MSTSLDSVPLKYRSNSDYLASLPPWRRLLARLNWHPTIDKKVAMYESEQRTKQLKLETEQIRKETALLRSENERLRKEDEQLRNEDERLRKEDERLAEIDARIAALWPSSRPSSTQGPPPANSCGT
jgi:predicted ribosome quality control (RQC) complex YloA/Tae2 family protein